MGGFAWVTLATNDSYSLGALVLAHSLRRAGTKHDLAVLITPGVTQVMRDKLATVFSLVQEVNVLDSKDEANLALLARPELGITFTKLHCWRLTQYEKCVFVDADALVIRNCDELFEREELSAAPDVGWPDCFNSGVFVFVPSQQTFASITAFAADKGSFDGGDQGLLNLYFSDWAHKDIAKHLPFIYNMCSTATYSYLPAYKQFGENARIIHFIGATKPWLQYFETETGVVHPPSGCNHLQPLLQLWWNIFCENVHSQLSPVMARSTLAPIWHRFSPSLPDTSSPSYPIYNDSSHDYFYRSQIIKNVNDYDDDYDEKPADFSEFNDPWEEYIPKYTAMENIVFYHQEYSSQQYYNDNETGPEVHHEFSQHSYQPPSVNHEDDNHRSQEPAQGQKNHENRDKNDNPWNTDDSYHDFKHHSDDRIGREEHREHYVTGNDQSGQFCGNKHDDNVENSRLQGNLEESKRVLRVDETDYFMDRNLEGINDRLHGESVKDDRQNSGEGFPSRDNDRNTESETCSFSQSLTCEPCTDPLHNVAQHNDQSVDSQGHLATDEAGIAGALAKMTLGEPRSAEQVALEEHMRRQGWEQGQIDYMGRDSFENIWKKICNTLNQAPQREPSPPKEEQSSRIESSLVPDSTPIAGPSPTTAIEIEDDANLPKPSEDLAATFQDQEIQSSTTETSNEPIVQDQPEIQAEVKVESSESQSRPEAKSVEVVRSALEIDSATEKPIASSEPENVKIEADLQSIQFAPIVQSSPISSETQLPAEPQEKSSASLEPEAVAEILDDSLASITPEIESSSDSKVEQFISTFEVAPTSENIPENFTDEPLVSEKLETVSSSTSETNVLESDTGAEPEPKPESEPVEDLPKIPILSCPFKTITAAPVDQTIETASELSEFILDSSSVPIQVAESVLQSEPKESASEDQSPVSEEAVSSVVAPVLESVIAVSETVAESKTEETKDSGASPASEKQSINNGIDVAVQSLSTEPEIAPTKKEIEVDTSVPQPEASKSAPIPEEKTEVAEDPAEEVEAEVESLSAVSDSSKSTSLTPPDSPSTQGPVRPARTKDPRIPTTPTVTEATPPNSPPIGAGQNLDEPPKTVKKVIKKVVKKVPGENEGGDGVEGETSGKKIVKKVVKKIVKKPKEAADDGAEASGTGIEKPKKIVKIVKKIVKPTESLEVDSSVPETPPAGVPVPPKRKTKTTTTTTTKVTTTTKNIPAETKPSESEP